MKRSRRSFLIVGAVVVAAAPLVECLFAQHSLPAQFPLPPRPDDALPVITIDYRLEGSIFPPKITAPAFVWRDATVGTAVWRIDVEFAGGPGIHPRCVAATNELPKLTPEQAAAWIWKPDAGTWDTLKKRSIENPATVTITGFREDQPDRPRVRYHPNIKRSCGSADL